MSSSLVFWRKLRLPSVLFIQDTKMYHDLKKVYWLEGMKSDNSMFVKDFPNFQEVKAEQLKPRGLT